VDRRASVDQAGRLELMRVGSLDSMATPAGYRNSHGGCVSELKNRMSDPAPVYYAPKRRSPASADWAGPSKATQAKDIAKALDLNREFEDHS